MISNEAQDRSTLAHLRRFEEALANLEESHGGSRSKMDQLEMDAVASQVDDLRGEIAEYDRLRSGQVSELRADTLGELASLLVRARIARGWTQRQLAESLGVAEQQIQRYEATNYRSASLARITDVAHALHLDIRHVGHLQGPSAA